MRRIFNLTALLLIILVACIGALLIRPPSWSKLKAEIAAALPAATPTSDRTSPFAKPESKLVVSNGPKKLEATSIEAPAEDPKPATATLQSVTYPFATSAEIGIGTSRADLLAVFGPPQATAIGADRGLLQERLVYRALPTRQTTVVALVNGKVTKAETFTDSEKRYE
jgi:hypothetical protein